MNTIQRLSAPVSRFGHQLKEKAKTFFSRWEISSYIRPKHLHSSASDQQSKRSASKTLQGEQSYKVSTADHAGKYIQSEPSHTPQPPSKPADSIEASTKKERLEKLWQSQLQTAEAIPDEAVKPEAGKPVRQKTSPPDQEIKQEDPEVEEFKADLKQQKLEKALAAGALGTAAATGASLAFASEVNERPSFDHILQKETPMDKMVFFAQHNSLAMPGKGSLPFAATNQSMGIGETLEKTPVRAFDLDLWERDSGEVVINHGGFYDPLVPESEMPTLADAVTPIRRWLDEPQNAHEVVILTFENKQNLDQSELQSLLGDRLMSSGEVNQLREQLGHAPTINELTADGPKVIVTGSTYYQESGAGSVNFGLGDMRSIWEDRTLAEAVDDQTFNALADKVLDNPDPLAPKITTEDVDQLVGAGRGRYISLDQVSANDPRFLT